MKRLLIALAVVIGMLALPATAAATPRTGTFVAHLTGDQETPPNDSLAQGEAILHMNADGTITWKLIVANIDNVFMAHIHIAARGVPGPVRQWLFPVSGPPPQLLPGRTDGILSQGTFTPTPEILAALESGNAYVNVHTFPAHPAGEIRGQLREIGSD
jgi:CHRD domain-containing protein